SSHGGHRVNSRLHGNRHGPALLRPVYGRGGYQDASIQPIVRPAPAGQGHRTAPLGQRPGFGFGSRGNLPPFSADASLLRNGTVWRNRGRLYFGLPGSARGPVLAQLWKLQAQRAGVP